MNRDAFGRRKVFRMKARRVVFDVLRGWQKTAGRGRVSGDHLLLVGDGVDAETRLNWYLPSAEVPIVASTPAPSAHQASEAGLDPELGHQHPRRAERAAGRAHRVVNDGLFRSIGEVIIRPSRTTLVSPTLYGNADCLGYLRLRRGFAPAVPGGADWPLHALDQTTRPDRWAVLAATGPSVDRFDLGDCSDADIRIACNSAVRNTQLLKTFKPNVICFGDPVFHFGPSEYARTFREDLRSAMDSLDAFVVVPEHYRGLLLEHMPELETRCVGLTLAAQPRRVPAKQQGATTRRTGNVLTQQMLPTALQLRPNRLSFVGCDGRKKEERYFWSHGKAVQYSDELMETVFKTHPSFFRDVSYTDYYDRHCDEMAGWVSLAEEQGAVVDTLTPSFIPALEQRLVG